MIPTEIADLATAIAHSATPPRERTNDDIAAAWRIHEELTRMGWALVQPEKA